MVGRCQGLLVLCWALVGLVELQSVHELREADVYAQQAKKEAEARLQQQQGTHREVAAS